VQTNYVATHRPETGLRNATFGMLLFLLAESMFFGSLFSSFVFLRAAANDWNIHAEALKPAVLLGASALAAAAGIVSLIAVKMRHYRRLEILHTAAFVFALQFAILLAYDFRVLYLKGHTPHSHTFFAVYYLLTGICCAHVLAAGLWHAYLIVFGARTRRVSGELYRNSLVCAAMLNVFSVVMWLITCTLFKVFSS
jgi:heme/copper-type cytochrome/quinol oxidase subunit 3